MTHDPREALEPCPFCGGEAERVDVPTDLGGDPNAGGSCIQCKRCTASTALHFDRKENLYSSWNDRCGRALTASPGEQKPVAHRIRVVDGSYCKVIPDGELEIWKQNWSTHLKSGHALLEPLYLSPPPAAGWDDNQLQLIIERALLDDEYFGNRAADEDQLEAQAHGSAALIVKALRREAPAPEGVSTPSAAAESNASVEARLREALTPSAATKVAYIGEFHFFVDDRNEDGEECTRMVTVPWTTTKEIMKAILDCALSAVGDEAKKSALSFKAAQNTAESDPSVTPDCLGADTGGRDSSSLPSGESDLSVTTGYLPPDPTAERRENARSPMQRLLDAAGWDAGSTRHKQLEDALDGARLRIVAAEGSADRREIVARQTCIDCGYCDPCDEKCPNCKDANEYGDYEGPTCEVCGGSGRSLAGGRR